MPTASDTGTAASSSDTASHSPVLAIGGAKPNSRPSSSAVRDSHSCKEPHENEASANFVTWRQCVHMPQLAVRAWTDTAHPMLFCCSFYVGSVVEVSMAALIFLSNNFGDSFGIQTRIASLAACSIHGLATSIMVRASLCLEWS